MALPSLLPFARRIGPGAGAALLFAACCGSSARAETAVQPPSLSPKPVDADEAAIGRFVMTPVAQGFLRLDTRSGQVSLCTIEAGQAQCRASADERAALEAEIDRLSRQNAALQGQGRKTAPESRAAPEDEERRFDRALDRAERFLRRMMQLFRDSSGDKRPAEPL